jgi:hypothetical protein
MLTLMSIQYDQQLAVDMYNSGRLLREVADYFQIPTPTLRSRLLQAGVQFRPKNGTAIEFSVEQTQFLKDSLTSGKSMAWVAKQLNVSGPVIHRLAKTVGVHQPKKQVQPHAQTMLELYKAKVHVDEIAKRFNTTRHTVYGCIDRIGVDLVDVMKKVYPARTPAERYRAAQRSIALRRTSDPVFLQGLRRRERNKRVNAWNKYKDQVMAFFAKGCQHCGSNSESASHLDAHHVDPSQKTFQIANVVTARPTQEELAAELAKCICLCANCHRELHAQQGELYTKGGATSKTAKQVAKARIRLSPIFDKFREGGCQVCGYNKKSGLSAHHFDPATKEFNPTRATSLRLSNKITIHELNKCTCLCENCHRKVHAGELICPPPRVVDYHSQLTPLTSPVP